MSNRIKFLIIFSLIFLILIFISNFYYNGKYSVTFETGTSEKLLKRYAKNSKIKKPANPIREGYVFEGWLLNGKEFDFNNNINSNIVLSAKWSKEEYITVKFDTDSDYKIEPIEILKGKSLDSIPTPSKEGYTFVNWYLNDKVYENTSINSDCTLKAVYKENVKEFNEGDLVLIIDTYSSSAYDNNEYSTAVGWTRKVLKKYDDLTNPYMVGDETGVTGFFKATSLEKK